MKKRIFIVLIVIALSLCILPACQMDSESFARSSVKTISKPYIAQYECVEARFGEENIIKYYDYIRVVLVNNEKMELVYKLKDGEKKTIDGKYTLDPETREIDAEIGILGYKFKKKVKVEKGGFIISHIILQKELYMKFQMNWKDPAQSFARGKKYF